MITLDILSDPICPWCLVGKTNLDRALEARPEHPFAIKWQPFQLNPDMPAGGVDRKEYLAAKFGGVERAGQVYALIQEALEAAGLHVDLGAIERAPNTLNAHRLIHWAGLEGCQSAMVSMLFEAYFMRGHDIGDAGVLSQLAEEVGLDGGVISRLLRSNGDANDIRIRDGHARARGVTGVPTHILSDRHVLVGAQPTDVWNRLIDEIAGRQEQGSDE